MASVTLTDAWIHLASDLSQSVTMAMTGESVTPSRPAETRRYAGGVVRTIVRPGVKRELSLGFELADRADVETLEGWIGKAIMFRDPRGRVIWGMFPAVEEAEIPGVADDVVNVNLTIMEITGSAAA